MNEQYQKHVFERQKESLPPLPLNAEQTAELVALLKKAKPESSQQLMTLFKERVPSGVDQSAYIRQLISQRSLKMKRFQTLFLKMMLSKF